MSPAVNEAIVTEHELIDSSSGDCPDDRDMESQWSLERFKRDFKIKIMSWTEEDMEVDMIGIHCAIGNALRRILLSETETMAVEKVELRNNTSLLQDEFLAHRLGLIPIRADPRLFNWSNLPNGPANGATAGDTDSSHDPRSTLIFSLKVRCVSDKSSAKGKKTATSASSSGGEKQSADGFIEVTDGRVLSRHMQWVPPPEATLGTSESRSGSGDGLPPPLPLLAGERPRVVQPDILIAKLAAGQVIDCDLVVVKGIGQDHAKFSPVATAAYRLMPKIDIVNPEKMSREQALRLIASFSPGVMRLAADGKTPVVVNARIDLNSRNHMRHEDLRNAVRSALIKDHLIFTIESTGARPPDLLLIESMQKLGQKCQRFLSLIPELSLCD